MKITKVMFNRKFNLSNYESLDIAAEAELIDDSVNVLEAWSILKDNAEMWFIDQQRKKTQALQQPVAPKPVQPSTPQQSLKNESMQPKKDADWIEMPSTEKGPWEKSSDLTCLEHKAIYDKICESGKAYDRNGYRYWLIRKDSSIEGLGRRRLEVQQK